MVACEIFPVCERKSMQYLGNQTTTIQNFALNLHQLPLQFWFVSAKRLVHLVHRVLHSSTYNTRISIHIYILPVKSRLLLSPLLLGVHTTFLSLSFLLNFLPQFSHCFLKSSLRFLFSSRISLSISITTII